MRRRDFIKAFVGSAAAWPLAVGAEQVRDVRRVAILLALPEDHPVSRLGLKAFRTGMEKLGWIEGKNVRYEIQSAGTGGRIRELAKEVVRRTPDIIYVLGTPMTVALHRATKNLPIVFAMSSDPVGDGVVESLARPDGNVTGFTALYPEIVGKWVQLLKEVAPGTKRAAVLFNPRTAPFAKSGVLSKSFETAARQIEVEPIMAPVHDDREIKATIKSLAQTQGGGLVVMADPFLGRRRALILETVARHRLPAVYPFSGLAEPRGLITYGPDILDIHRRSADYVDRILKGVKPGDLPIQAPTKFELVINLKTAKALGLTVPPILLARADKVIE